MSRRRTLIWLAGALTAPRAFAQVNSHSPPPAAFAPVVSGYVMRFPRDTGSHPEFRLEWWYITGWLNGATGHPLGFQVTFFRARPALKHANPSAFTPHHIMIAHAAISDPARGRLVHAQRAARAGFGLAGAAEGHTHVWIDDWSLERRANVYRADIAAREFRFELEFQPTQPPLLQGEQGLSRKGPAPESASYYYSLPHLNVGGTLARSGKTIAVNGTAWLDHEWSSSYLAESAVGWDWIGINLEGGGALMAFRMRDKAGKTFWAGGTLRRPDGSVRTFQPSQVHFTPQRHWRSPRSGTNYPVSWTVRAGEFNGVIEPLMDDQENDARASTGTIYWEGAVRALQDGQIAGRGYLELTGYWRPQQL